MANLELEVPNSPDTKFRIGSITKTFTVAAILQLQEQGRLSTSNSVCKYIENCPESWKGITIHHLLTHTSGIPTYTNPQYMKIPANVRSPHNPLELVMLSRDKPLDFEPGSKYLYDNTGYAFLGAIIEKVSGEKYGDYLRTHIFDPLEMKNSGYDDMVTILQNRASGYELWATGLENARYQDMSVWHAAGAVYSTVRDLYRWDRALYTEKVLTKASLTKAWSPEKDEHGYSWSLQPMAGHKQIGHTGGVIGFESCIARFPDDDAFVVVLSNFEGTNPQGIAHELAMVIFGQKVLAPGERPSIEIDSQVLDRYTGVYTNGSRTLTVTNEYGRLTIAGSGGIRWQALAASETEFFILEADATYTFVSGDGGRAKELHFNDGSRIITLKRK